MGQCTGIGTQAKSSTASNPIELCSAAPINVDNAKKMLSHSA